MNQIPFRLFRLMLNYPTLRLKGNWDTLANFLSQVVWQFITVELASTTTLNFFSSKRASVLLKPSPASGRSTSCRAWRSDRWLGLLGSSMARGWNHPGARGSAGSSGNHGDSAGSNNRGHPDGFPAPFQHLAAEDAGLGRVTITHMTNTGVLSRRARRRSWTDEPASVVGQQNICKNQNKGEKRWVDVWKKAKLCSIDEYDEGIKIAVKVS